MGVIWPIGPFPRAGATGAGVVDLSALWRDACFTSAVVRRDRAALKSALAGALDAQDWQRATALLQHLVDTWPLAGMVDGALNTWRAGLDGGALAVLARAAEVRCAVDGQAGPWPVPGDDWVRENAGEVSGVARLHPADGADALAALFECPLVDDVEFAMPPLVVVAGTELAAKRAVLLSAVERGALAGVIVQGAMPDDPDAWSALNAIRAAAPAQSALERYGLAGLCCVDVPTFGELLVSPEPGEFGDVLRPLCDSAMLPGTPARLRQGRTDTVGWLLWEAARPPLAVHPVAVELLRALDGRRSLSEIAVALPAHLDEVTQVAEQLVSVGAATAV